MFFHNMLWLFNSENWNNMHQPSSLTYDQITIFLCILIKVQWLKNIFLAYLTLQPYYFINLSTAPHFIYSQCQIYLISYYIQSKLIWAFDSTDINMTDIMQQINYLVIISMLLIVTILHLIVFGRLILSKMKVISVTILSFHAFKRFKILLRASFQVLWAIIFAHFYFNFFIESLFPIIFFSLSMVNHFLHHEEI